MKEDEAKWISECFMAYKEELEQGYAMSHGKDRSIVEIEVRPEKRGRAWVVGGIAYEHGFLAASMSIHSVLRYLVIGANHDGVKRTSEYYREKGRVRSSV